MNDKKKTHLNGNAESASYCLEKLGKNLRVASGWPRKEIGASKESELSALTDERHPWFCAHCQAGVPNVHVTYEEFHDPNAGGCGYRVGDWPERASTVLTDERIEAMYFDAVAQAERSDDTEHKNIISRFARAIEREIKSADAASFAAQAGQVAVPSISGLKIQKLNTDYFRIEHDGRWATAYLQATDIQSKLLASIAKAYLDAAPLPAKESKCHGCSGTGHYCGDERVGPCVICASFNAG